ncbi:putative Phosphoglycerate mutase [Vibrio nigripulchritudo MADA3029]|uniref:histidine phosphatase family protein n=1 Tax=Vibrio nigripulchritudo TaxID=28173 RepID=UPI0003B1DD62|nr:histidine phosphatase family protein [Vibrio nigripulchritudo]CCN46665.1 putative Phosphoglycerate mutase [Vibrio nigripulchritudo MADA3020]CCN54558.1 putative Phosphoglycerate mutase [Vibrio nigripulchritudo MADA3021]CCN59524.1 putative Phosphoglycerate mutase [Vibrio nigripulchritudo MADA3029]
MPVPDSVFSSKLILIRHGETEWNRAKIMQGWLDSKLTAKGRDQVRSAAVKLRSLQCQSPIAIYTSDLGRAMASARIIANQINGYLVVDKRLRERNYGEFQGKLIGDLPPSSFHQAIESDCQYLDRIQSIMSDITKRKSSYPTVVVGHGEWIGTYLKHYTHQAAFEIPKNGQSVFVRERSFIKESCFIREKENAENGGVQ